MEILALGSCDADGLLTKQQALEVFALLLVVFLFQSIERIYFGYEIYRKENNAKISFLTYITYYFYQHDRSKFFLYSIFYLICTSICLYELIRLV